MLRCLLTISCERRPWPVYGPWTSSLIVCVCLIGNSNSKQINWISVSNIRCLFYLRNLRTMSARAVFFMVCIHRTNCFLFTVWRLLDLLLVFKSGLNSSKQTVFSGVCMKWILYCHWPKVTKMIWLISPRKCGWLIGEIIVLFCRLLKKIFLNWN